jgi:hypothetical protein
MKHDAIVSQGIPIHERVELPESWIPADSRVEIDAKITAGRLLHPPRYLPQWARYLFVIGLKFILGYFTTGHRMTEEELAAVKGRSWDECVPPRPF